MNYLSTKQILTMVLIAAAAGLTEAAKQYPDVPWVAIALAVALALNKLDWLGD